MVFSGTCVHCAFACVRLCLLLQSSTSCFPPTAGLQVLAAMCTLLSMVLPRLPNAVLHSKFGQSSRVLAAVVESKQEDAGVLRPALACLSQVLAAAGEADWPAALPPFNLTLRCASSDAAVFSKKQFLVHRSNLFSSLNLCVTACSCCLDQRPKVRKRAQTGLVDVLAGLQHCPPGLHAASEAVLRVCQHVLPAPEAAARAAAAAPHKKQQQAEQAITQAVADALHLLGALKHTIFLLSGEPRGLAATACLPFFSVG